jgi:DNA (cytosine-5)-methyltransferase 1
MTLFDLAYEPFKSDKPIRLIELFAGVGSQAMALRNIGANFEHYRISEWEVSATASYKAIHMENDNTDYSLEIEIAKLPKTLFDYGISTNGKEPMTLEQIERKGEKWQRITYNNLRATNNLGSICNFKGEDLEIVDTDSFTYLLTYSFPCQDLSVAGKMKGMAKGDNTRSGLLWEVERLLNEVEELPQVLLMENVPQVIGKKNIADFELWQKFLEEKGYSNFVNILNAKDYGVAQNRKRCFMVSILGEWNYNFPKPIPLTKTMKDYLEDEVDEKYYINSEKAQKLIQQLMESGQLKDNRQYADGTINEPKTKDISNCCPTLRSQRSGLMTVEPALHKIGNIYDSKGQNGNIYSNTGISPAISSGTTENKNNGGIGSSNAPKVIVASRGRNPQNPSDRTPGNYVEQRLEPNSEGICNTLTSVQKDNGEIPDAWDLYNKNPINNGISKTLGADCGHTGTAGATAVTHNYRIRKLTPKECWRLMGFTDEDFHKAEQVNSNTQLYKQAGNSIVVNVLEGIFKQMLPSEQGTFAPKKLQNATSDWLDDLLEVE